MCHGHCHFVGRMVHKGSSLLLGKSHQKFENLGINKKNEDSRSKRTDAMDLRKNKFKQSASIPYIEHKETLRRDIARTITVVAVDIPRGCISTT